MDFLYYAIIADLIVLFILFIILIVALFNQRVQHAHLIDPSTKRCITCGQILEEDWKRCPFCSGQEKQEPSQQG